MGTLLYLIKSLFICFREVLYALIYYKNFKVYLCNHLTIGVKKLFLAKATLPHPVGIVIGMNVKVGMNCTIYQNVTIGTKDVKNYVGAAYPTIGNGVVIYANAIIFGNITIGDNAVIGAGAVVFNDVAANSIVVGNPARVIR